MLLCQQCDKQAPFLAPYRVLPTPGSNDSGLIRRHMRLIPIMLLMLLAGMALSIDESRMLRVARSLGPPAVEGMLAWQKMHNAAAPLPESAKVTAVNRFFNQRIRFIDDVVVWGQPDYWATPLETLYKGAGDCEDYAIAKYFTLLALDIPPSRLRLTYVRAAMNREGEVTFVPHMVLTYYPQPGKEPLVLDNLIETIQPASARSDLRPVFSFNSEGLWEQMGNNASTVSLDRLSRWRDLLQRVGSEGFR
jgi:predicted transglutaminase-like cysteine proteinase